MKQKRESLDMYNDKELKSFSNEELYKINLSHHVKAHQSNAELQLRKMNKILDDSNLLSSQIKEQKKKNKSRKEKEIKI